MTTPAVIVPDARLPLSDDYGLISMVWQRFFVGLWQRTGGAQGPGTVITADLSLDGTFSANSDSLVASQKATKTYVDGELARATLSLPVPVSGTTRNTVHGLPAVPWHLSVWLECVSAELGWGVGAVVQGSGLTAWADSSDVFVLVQDTGIKVLDQGTGVASSIIPGNWTLEVRAQV